LSKWNDWSADRHGAPRADLRAGFPIGQKKRQGKANGYDAQQKQTDKPGISWRIELGDLGVLAFIISLLL